MHGKEALGSYQEVITFFQNKWHVVDIKIICSQMINKMDKFNKFYRGKTLKLIQISFKI